MIVLTNNVVSYTIYFSHMSRIIIKNVPKMFT